MANETRRFTPPDSFLPSWSIHSPMSSASARWADRSRTCAAAAAADPPDEVDRLARREAVERDLGLGLDGAGPTGEGRVGDDVAAVDA